jgi:hypothetical protein
LFVQEAVDICLATSASSLPSESDCSHCTEIHYTDENEIGVGGHGLDITFSRTDPSVKLRSPFKNDAALLEQNKTLKDWNGVREAFAVSD